MDVDMSPAADETTANLAKIPPLARLPMELLHRITYSFSTADLCAIRLSCRAIETALFTYFSQEFFRRKQFMLTDFSIQALLDIAEHPALSQALQHVSFGLDRFTPVPVFHFDDEQQALWYHEAAAAQHSFLNSGRAAEMLTAAFSKLPNLKTVDIRDFDSPTRFRDGARNGGPGTWSSYGATTVFQKTGLSYKMTPRETSEYATTVFSLLVNSLAKAEARPEGLEVLIRQRSSGLFDYGFNTTCRNLPQHDALLAGLRRLHVDIALHNIILRASRLNDRPHLAPQNVILSGVEFGKFLAKTKRLEWLRINFQRAPYAAAVVFFAGFAQLRCAKDMKEAGEMKTAVPALHSPTNALYQGAPFAN